MASRNRSSEDATINLTPMIDVVFLLVIFFMVGAKFSDSESHIDVDAPSVGSSSALSRTPDQRVVEVRPDGTLSLDGVPISRPELAISLKQKAAAYPGLKVAVRGDKDTRWELIADIMGLVQESGVDKVGALTKSNRSGGGGIRR